MGDYDLPPWLISSPDEPAKYLLHGAQVGSQIGANWQRGQALAEQRRQFNVEQQRLAELDAGIKRVQDQNLELGRLHINTEIRKRQEQVDSEKAYSKVSQLWSEHSLAGIAGTDASEARIWSTIANNTSFYLHPGSKDFLAKMALSRTAREKTDQHEQDVLFRTGVEEIKEEGRNERAALAADSRENVADIRSEAQVEAASIRAEASARSLLNTKEFQTFMARKQAIVSDISLSLPKKYNEIEALEREYGVVHKTDAGGATQSVAPVPDVPRFQWTPTGIKEKK